MLYLHKLKPLLIRSKHTIEKLLIYNKHIYNKIKGDNNISMFYSWQEKNVCFQIYIKNLKYSIF